jgi:hypothetical protein
LQCSVAARALRAIGLLSCAVLPGCMSSVTGAASIWPPPDFYIEVQEVRMADAQIKRRLQIWEDGTVLYGKATDMLHEPKSGLTLPVFRTVCAYRLLPETIRLLSRKVYKRGIQELDVKQGQPSAGSVSILLVYHGMGHDLRIVASGQIHGAMVRVVRAINSYMPPNEEFLLSGMAGDREPSTLRGVPEPVDNITGALTCYRELAERFPEDAGLALDTFSLACAAGDRVTAATMLVRYRELNAVTAKPAPSPEEPSRLDPAVLERLLPEARG